MPGIAGEVCVVAVCIFGTAVDNLTPLQLSELRDEGISWLFFAAALAPYPRQERAAVFVD